MNIKRMINAVQDIYYYPKLSNIQRKYLFLDCPNCECGNLHAVSGNSDEVGEDYLWCDTCDLSMDSSGGYIA